MSCVHRHIYIIILKLIKNMTNINIIFLNRYIIE